MVDPVHLTNYKRTTAQLEEVLLFSILVAGKTALTIARLLDRMLNTAEERSGHKGDSPFQILQSFDLFGITWLLREVGIGCYNRKSIAVYGAVNTKINLRKCTLEELEALYGVGPKTSRLFLLHTRPNQQLAALDTHILKHLAANGYSVPNRTPGSRKYYRELETVCLRLAAEAKMSPADWDLSIWNHYRSKA